MTKTELIQLLEKIPGDPEVRVRVNRGMVQLGNCASAADLAYLGIIKVVEVPWDVGMKILLYPREDWV